MYSVDRPENLFETLAIVTSKGYMTKTKYDKILQELEEKEGKLFTIPEVSSMLHVDQETLHSYIRLHDIHVLKIQSYKTQRNQTLLPAFEVLRIMAKCTPLVRMLLALKEIGYDDDILNDLIDELEDFQREV